MPVFCSSASCRLLTPCGLILWATCGEAVSRWSLSGLPTRRLHQLIYNRSFLYIWLGVRVQAGTQRISRNGDTLLSLVPSLKTFWTYPLPESLKTRIIQTKQSLLPVLSVCMFVCSQKRTFSPHWTRIKELMLNGSRISREDAWLGRRSSLRCALDFLAQHQH